MSNYERIAKIAHEINRAYCEALGDTSQVAWDDAPDWQKNSALNGVIFHVDNSDRTPEQSHINWMKEKLSAGWTYGPVKDVVKKTHPCMVFYEDLPQEQKVKDYLFRAIVHNLKDELI